MKKILNDIQILIQNAIKQEMPEVSFEDLEENGKVFYMNGKNGTAYDWFVNEHLPAFMVFYNDADNLGAVKALVYTDGGVSVYLYDEQGKNLKQEIKTQLDLEEAKMLMLAVYLRLAADEKRIWDAPMDKLESDHEMDVEDIKEFIKIKRDLGPSIRRKEMMSQMCVASKKITREGWKVGFMLRDELRDDADSGWQFFAGDEDDEYVNNPENIELCPVYTITKIDPAVMNYLDNPIGIKLVCKSAEEFEADRNQRAYMERWKLETKAGRGASHPFFLIGKMTKNKPQLLEFYVEK